MSAPGDEIAAAGGVLWRRTSGGEPEYAVIHRPKYDDWTLAKGKLDPGETHEQAALREVVEETGFTAEPGPDLGEVTYLHDARPKRVRYWGMQARAGGFAANAEVDDIRWLGLDDARRQLTYDRDREVLDRFAATLDD